MQAAKFKPGDWVRCIDSENTSPKLVMDGLYKVEAPQTGYEDSTEWVWLSVREHVPQPMAYAAERFTLTNERNELVPIAESSSVKPEVGTGIKHDQDKPDMSLLSSIAILEVAKVMTFGKKKYAAHNWRGGFAWSRPLAAALRHTFAFIGGEDKDPETGLSHLAHAICCLIFVLEFTVTGAGKDDRYKQEPK